MNDQQLLRYSRHILLPQVDIDGQEKLLASRVMVVGLGGLGSPVALYLAASGVGNLVLVDDDRVELSNLQRQIAHSSDAIGQWKVESAKTSAQALNPGTEITTINTRLDEPQLRENLANTDVIVDCTDNLATRLMINRCSYQACVPLVSAAAIGTEGQLMVVDSRQASACYRCLYNENSDAQLNCAESGVLAPLVGVMGAMQALETLKVLLGKARVGKLLLYDAWRGEWNSLMLPKLADCPVCGGT